MIRFRPLLVLVIAASIPALLDGQSAADTAFQQSFRLDVPDASAFAFTTFTVPDGKRLVIRYLTATATLPSGQRFTSSVQTTLRESASDFPQQFSSQSNNDGTDELVSTQAVTIQADAGTTVYFQVFRRIPKGSFRVTFVVSGDLINMP